MKRLILIEVLSYGQVFRYPLDSLQNVPAQPGATYAVVESKSDEIPDDLLIRRKGDALEIMIDGKPVAEIGDFYGVDSTATYSIDGSSAPTQAMLISGADSAVINDGAVLWQAEGGGSGWGSLSPWVWWGAGGALAVGGAVALVGGSSDSGATESTTPTTSSSPADEAPPSGDSTPALDQVAPTILSPAVAQAIDENSGAGQVVYTVTSDDGAATYSLGSSYDSAAFSIDLNSGEVRLSVNPDYESQPSFHFTVLATDPAGNSSAPQAVSLAINDLDDDPGPPPAEDETPPTITSGATAPAIDENSGAGQVVYTVTSDDASASYSLRPGQSRQNFSIDPESGEVTLAANPDYEEQESYSFTVVATDPTGNSSEQSVFLAINDLDDEGDDDDDDPPPADETPPTILSGATAPAIDENSGAGQVVYTVTSDDDRATYSLGASGDSASFSIDQDSGVVIFSVDPDFESQESYIFNVLATDPAGNSSEQLVSLSINDLDDDPPPVVDETPPTISSGAIAPAIDENSGAGQVVYTVTSDDGAATYSLGSSPDSAAFSIDAASGEVRLLVDPDFESQESYIFNVLATDPAGNSSEQPVSLAINDLDEEDPDITALNVGTEAGPDSSIVVFDLVAGQSSDHSGRTFSAEVEYSIYIMVDSDGFGLENSGAGWGVWSGADNLGADDTVVIVGDSGLIDPVPSYQAGAISDGAMLVAGDQLRLSAGFSIPDYTEDGGNFSVIEGLSVGSDGLLQRWGESVSEQYSSTATTADLWNGTISDFRASGSPDHYLAAMPAGLLTSQGLA